MAVCARRVVNALVWWQRAHLRWTSHPASLAGMLALVIVLMAGMTMLFWKGAR